MKIDNPFIFMLLFFSSHFVISSPVVFYGEVIKLIHKLTGILMVTNTQPILNFSFIDMSHIDG